MKQWTDSSLRWSCVAAALALLIPAIAVGWPNAGRAESQLSTPANLSRTKLERVGDFIRNEIAAGNIPGAVLLIQQHGQPVYFEKFGVRDVESRRPMTPDTIFRLYSMSKPVTSVAAMMLVEDGKLSLDDPVAKHIPAFADVKVGVEKTDESGKPQLSLEPLRRPITIEDLLRHTSGLTYGFYGETAVRKLYDKSEIYDGDFDNATFVERLARLPLADQPGTLWDYGHSTDVLGRVIEVVSGQSLFQFEKQRLLDPLGMADTAFFVGGCREVSTDCRTDARGSLDRSRRRDQRSAGVAALGIRRAGMVGTIGDYARFAQMLLNGGTLDGRRYLKPETIALMTSDHIGPETKIARDDFSFSWRHTAGSALALPCERSQPSEYARGRSANTAGTALAGTFFFIDPKDDMFVICMMQTPSQRGRIQLALKTLIYQALGR